MDSRLQPPGRWDEPRRGSMLSSRLRYYASSLPTLLTGVRNRPVWAGLVLHRPGRPNPVLHLAGGLKLEVRSALDAWVVKETCLDRDYEPEGFAVQPGWIVVDLGAGLGEFAVSAGRRCAPGLVYAYEPYPESFDLLLRNIALNGAANVRAFPHAVGASVGPMRLAAAGGVPVLQRAGADVDGAARGPAVSGTTLEEIFRLNGIERCDLLKIDCEGEEYEILLNASQDLLAAIERICLEYHNGAQPPSHVDLIRFLEGSGYAVSARPNPVHAHTGLLYARRVSHSGAARLADSRQVAGVIGHSHARGCRR